MVLLQEGRASHRGYQILHLPLQPGKSGSITCVALPAVWGCSACRRAAHARRRTRLEAHALKTGQPDPPAIEGQHAIDPDPVEPVCARLVEWDDVGMRLDDLQQKVLVTEARQTILLGI